MEATVKASNTLKSSDDIFTPYQVQMADKIFNLILETNYEELGQLVNTIETKTDYEYIHYAFYVKHEFGWLSYVQKRCTYEECIRYGFYNYDF